MYRKDFFSLIAIIICCLSIIQVFFDQKEEKKLFTPIKNFNYQHDDFDKKYEVVVVNSASFIAYLIIVFLFCSSLICFVASIIFVKTTSKEELNKIFYFILFSMIIFFVIFSVFFNLCDYFIACYQRQKKQKEINTTNCFRRFCLSNCLFYWKSPVFIFNYLKQVMKKKYIFFYYYPRFIMHFYQPVRFYSYYQKKIDVKTLKTSKEIAQKYRRMNIMRLTNQIYAKSFFYKPYEFDKNDYTTCLLWSLFFNASAQELKKARKKNQKIASITKFFSSNTFDYKDPNNEILIFYITHHYFRYLVYYLMTKKNSFCTNIDGIESALNYYIDHVSRNSRLDADARKLIKLVRNHSLTFATCAQEVIKETQMSFSSWKRANQLVRYKLKEFE